jgi:hypothetical protein
MHPTTLLKLFYCYAYKPATDSWTVLWTASFYADRDPAENINADPDEDLKADP